MDVIDLVSTLSSEDLVLLETILYRGESYEFAWLESEDNRKSIATLAALGVGADVIKEALNTGYDLEQLKQIALNNAKSNVSLADVIRFAGCNDDRLLEIALGFGITDPKYLEILTEDVLDVLIRAKVYGYNLPDCFDAYDYEELQKSLVYAILEDGYENDVEVIYYTDLWLNRLRDDLTIEPVTVAEVCTDLAIVDTDCEDELICISIQSENPLHDVKVIEYSGSPKSEIVLESMPNVWDILDELDSECENAGSF